MNRSIVLCWRKIAKEWFCECRPRKSLFFPGNDSFTQLPLKGLRVRALPWRLCLSNHRENVYQVAVLNYLENEENDDVEKKTQFVISEDDKQQRRQTSWSGAFFLYTETKLPQWVASLTLPDGVAVVAKNKRKWQTYIYLFFYV